MPQFERVFELLDQLYAELPTIECQGLCWNSCGPIDMSAAERERIEARGVHIQPFTEERAERWARDEPLHCAALDEFRRCTVYDVRPLICRLWGVGRGQMACRHGCKIEGKRLKHHEIMAFVVRSLEIGGLDRPINGDLNDIRVFMEDPQLRDMMARYTNGERSLRGQIEARIDELRSRRA